MRMKFILSILGLIMLLQKMAIAQSTFCPPNIDFETGSYGYWKFYRGACCPINTPTLGQVNGRHTLTAGSAVDPFGGFPVVAPNGGTYSLKLGNSNNGAQAEKAVYYVHIPPTLNNFSLIYNFAVVFEDPNHAPADQPRFEVAAFDSATNLPVPCAQYTYVSGSGLPGFTYLAGPQVWYRPWSTASLDLSGYAGHTIIVSFASGDCALNGHFGYGYVDLACSLFQISSSVCNGQSTQNFNAPPGFMTYQWYDSTYSNLIGTTQNITIPTPPQNSAFHVILTPYPGYGCPDTLTSIVNIIFPTSSTLYQTICEPDSFLGYSQTGTYVDTLVNSTGCDSFRTLHLTVIPLHDTTINQTICQPNSFLGYTSSGLYIDTFTTTVNGCDSIRNLYLNVLPQTFSTINQTICQPDSYLGYSNSGTYIDTFINSVGCDSLRTLHLTVNQITYSTFNQSICNGDTFMGYSSAGTYIDTFTNSNGCDSIRTIQLSVLPILTTVINQTICQPNSYLGYSSSGTYVDTFTSIQYGCDSIRTIHLTVKAMSFSNLFQTICQPDSYLGYSGSGIYIDTLINSLGCDSIRTLNLTVLPVTYSTLNQVICQPNTFLGYSSSGTYTDVLTNAAGCDSIRTLHLTVHPITSSIISQTICEPDTFLGYTNSGTYIDTLVNANGCDSIRTLYLTVKPIVYNNIYQQICSPNSYLGYSGSGIYSDTFQTVLFGCDSIRILHLTVHPTDSTFLNQTICEPTTFMGHNSTGVYVHPSTNSFGCDSTVVLNLTVNPRSYDTIYQTICEPGSYLGYTQSGVYYDTLVNAAGCDSIRILELTVNPITYSVINQSICDSDSFLGYTVTGTYYDTLTNLNGCDSIRILHLTVHPVYNIDTVVNKCHGSQYFAGGAWQTTDGNYTDYLLSSNGCDSIVHTNLSFVQVLFPELGNDSTFCIGDSVLLFPGHYNFYYWWNGSQNDRQYVYQAGTYYVTVSNDLTCYGSDTIELSTFEPPNIQILHSIKDLCKSDTINLYGSGALTYAWYLNDYFNVPRYTGPSFNFAVNTQTKITLIGTDENNCKGQDEVTLYNVPCCGNVSIPNAFSPNGDDKNDFFHPLTNAVFEEYSFRIYDRWGKLVFDTKNSNDRWDGRFKGKDAEVGTYYYFLRTKCFEESSSRIFKGDVTLLR